MPTCQPANSETARVAPIRVKSDNWTLGEVGWLPLEDPCELLPNSSDKALNLKRFPSKTDRVPNTSLVRCSFRYYSGTPPHRHSTEACQYDFPFVAHPFVVTCVDVQWHDGRFLPHNHYKQGVGLKIVVFLPAFRANPKKEPCLLGSPQTTNRNDGVGKAKTCTFSVSLSVQTRKTRGEHFLQVRSGAKRLLEASIRSLKLGVLS